MTNIRHVAQVLTLLLISVFTFAQSPQQTVHFTFDPAKSSASFALDATMHTVHGSFALKHGSAQFDPVTKKMSGEIVLDATSAHTGNEGRDKKMHKEILESARFPEIIFRPDRVEGKVAQQGVSNVQLHGIFSIHGAEHEMIVPVTVESTATGWTAISHFTVPYVKWGMKNPSNFFLHVKDSVEIEVHAAGTLPSLPKSQ
jgi:polyisoprenoid-binding protein YceI